MMEPLAEFYAMYAQHLPSGLLLQSLKHLLLKISVLNLAIVAIVGVVLRCYPIMSVPFNYGFLLHGHSHFAFGGWVMPILLWMILHYFPLLAQKVPFRHWRNISLMLLFSAYGMLFSFPFEGYASLSIFFSTISVLAGIYLSLIIWDATSNDKANIPVKFLRAGLFYLCLSSIGPFATAPIIAMGGAGTPLYYNAIYFYLHFQYNGWFSFAILAVLTKIMEAQGPLLHGKTMFRLFNVACIPAFLLSTLWNHPGSLFNLLGGAAAFITMIAVLLLIFNFRKLFGSSRMVKSLMSLAMVALVLKVLLQLMSAFPAVADLGFHSRNFIVAYLHLVLLGFITLFAFAFILNGHPEVVLRRARMAISSFLFSFISTELLLVIQTSLTYINLQIPNYSILLLYCSLLFPISAVLLFSGIKRTAGSILQLKGLWWYRYPHSIKQKSTFKEDAFVK